MDDDEGADCARDREDVVAAYAQLMTYVQAQDQYSDAAKAAFADHPDGWLMAYALCEGATVVTHEAPNANIKNKVPIPNVCNAFGIPYIDTFEMLRRLGVVFSE